jgi:hypothetical protein
MEMPLDSNSIKMSKDINAKMSKDINVITSKDINVITSKDENVKRYNVKISIQNECERINYMTLNIHINK